VSNLLTDGMKSGHARTQSPITLRHIRVSRIEPHRVLYLGNCRLWSAQIHQRHAELEKRARVTIKAELFDPTIAAHNGLQRLRRQLAGYKLLIIDELGYVPLSTTGAEMLFEVFSQRYGQPCRWLKRKSLVCQ
jgi:hypothetical protein